MARPRVHDRLQIVTAVCARISRGALVKDACKAEKIDADLIRDWTSSDDALALLYARARSNQAHAIAEEAVRISDEKAASPEAVQRNRLRVDTRKWMASKIAPKLYSERLVNEHSGPDGGPIKVEQIWKFGSRAVVF